MKDLIKRHYQATKSDKAVGLHDFFEKTADEMTEFSNTFYHNEGIEAVNQKAIDLMMVLVNLCQWMGIDIEKELLKNIEAHENNSKL